MAETVKNIAVLEKALHIMEFLLAYPKGVQLNEISIGVGLNKSTVYRILHTLRLHNYVIQDEKDSSYSLGNRFLLYSPFIQSLSINNVALPFMQEFSDRYDFSTSLATLDKDTRLPYLPSIPPDPQVSASLQRLVSAVHYTAVPRARSFFLRFLRRHLMNISTVTI